MGNGEQFWPNKRANPNVAKHSSSGCWCLMLHEGQLLWNILAGMGIAPGDARMVPSVRTTAQQHPRLRLADWGLWNDVRLVAVTF